MVNMCNKYKCAYEINKVIGNENGDNNNNNIDSHSCAKIRKVVSRFTARGWCTLTHTRTKKYAL